jgi:hypothetical protein
MHQAGLVVAAWAFLDYGQMRLLGASMALRDGF